MIYLDHNATTPVDKHVLEAMWPFFSEEYANPASEHQKGLISKNCVDRARENVAHFLGGRSDEIIFTSGATEANNLALIGLSLRAMPHRNHIITSSIEHPAVLAPAKHLESQGFRITYIPVDEYGLIDLDYLRSSITNQTFLISVMFANNEIGTIEPISEIGAIAKENNIYFHTDAAQAIGHIPVNVDKMNIDLMSVSAHKFYGPKGVGCLFVRNRIPRVILSPIIYGGGQEKGLRSGTLNVPGIVGMAEACKIAKKEMGQNSTHNRDLASQILIRLKKKRRDVKLNGHPELRLLHTINIEIPNIDNKWLVLKMKDFCFSTASACSAYHDEPSHVLSALGLSKEKISNCIRIGIGKGTTKEELEIFLNKLTSLI
ncbi:MAG: cysteine desulfurase [Planctomycetes bacterium]|nr:cysteine desulfurase [Planctomycetota bacterium]